MGHRPSACWCVLQAMDAAGKDGTIKHVMSGVNPRVAGSCRSRSPPARSSATTSSGAAPGAPRTGADRYLQSLVLRGGPGGPGPSRAPVDAEHRPSGAPAAGEVWGTATRTSTPSSTTCTATGPGSSSLSAPLPGGTAEAPLRTPGRPGQVWKFSTADLAEREHWDDYHAAYEEALTATSTPWAPWYVCPPTTSTHCGPWWAASWSTPSTHGPAPARGRSRGARGGGRRPPTPPGRAAGAPGRRSGCAPDARRRGKT